MQMPSLLPETLFPYRQTTSPDELFLVLSQNSDDFVTFMLICFDDETWCTTYRTFTEKALLHLSHLVFSNQLSLSEVKLIAKSLQEHYSNLRVFLPLNLLCELDQKKRAVHNILFQAASPFFQHLIRTQCFEKKSQTFPLPNVSLSDFKILEEFIYTGEVKELWRLKQSEIHQVFQLAHGFELVGLKEECEQLLLRYISQENLFEFLAFADRYSLPHIKIRCCELLNEIRPEIQFTPKDQQVLTCELSKSTEGTLEQFVRLTPYITHFIALNEVMEDTAVIALLEKCPRLFSIHIGHTTSFSEKVLQLHRFKELVLSGCGWLRDIHLKRYIASFSQLHKLDLTSCSAITATGWGELTKLPSLVSLTLDRCDRLTDQELELILISARRLRELVLSECRQLSDFGFYALATSHQPLVSLDLGRTAILDRNLLEITTRLTNLQYLGLERCQNLTEQGIIDALKVAPSLAEVNLSHLSISEGALKELLRTKPSLKIS
jgi:hypothetical protein